MDRKLGEKQNFYKVEYNNKKEREKGNLTSHKYYPKNLAIQNITAQRAKTNIANLTSLKNPTKYKSTNKIEDFSKEMKEFKDMLKKQEEMFLKKINDLTANIQYLETGNNYLQSKNIELQIKLKDQEKTIRYLKQKVNELDEFHFSAKLRKLMKNLLGFIIDRFYPDYIKYDRINDKIYFFDSPIITDIFYLDKTRKTIQALNKLLEIIFSSAKEKDFVIHLIDPRAMNNKFFKRNFYVFKNENEFFSFFNIPEDYRNILVQLIPREYFTIIDNVTFEVNIKELMNNIANRY